MRDNRHFRGFNFRKLNQLRLLEFGMHQDGIRSSVEPRQLPVFIRAIQYGHAPLYIVC